jgi:hypothetical protein
VPTTREDRHADQHDLAAALVVDLGLAMDLGHQRAGGVEVEEVAALGFLGDRLRHAVGRENHRRLGVGDFGEFLDENRALGLEALDHVAVVHDLVTDIDRGAIALQRLLDESIARTTPAQKPRGEQSRTLRGGLAEFPLFSAVIGEK